MLPDMESFKEPAAIFSSEYLLSLPSHGHHLILLYSSAFFIGSFVPVLNFIH